MENRQGKQLECLGYARQNLTEREAKKLTEQINSRADTYGTYFFKAVPQDHVLGVCEP